MLLFSLLAVTPFEPPVLALVVIFGLCLAGAVAFWPRSRRP